MTEFIEGEYVDIVIPQARIEQVDERDDERFLTVAYGTHMTVIRVEDAATITRVAPAEWPPQSGDLWRDRNGDLWFCARHWPDYDDPKDSRGVNDEGWRPVLVPIALGDAGSPERPDDVVQPYGPFTLVRRESQDGV